ncbi:hypothetical protein B0H13DRAFT_1863224 [Mycena leptocephala]|nr:hypothetical protein B0H13DRAFT_1863224 [Mycena leptocephala]
MSVWRLYTDLCARTLRRFLFLWAQLWDGSNMVNVPIIGSSLIHTPQNISSYPARESKPFAVRLEDNSKQLLFEDKWISSFDPKVQPQVALCVIRDSCCQDPTENKNGFCSQSSSDKCGMQFLKEEPLYLAIPGTKDATTTTSSVPSQSTPSPMTLTLLPPIRDDSPEAVHADLGRPASFVTLNYPGALNGFERSLGNYLSAAHSFIIAPPFVHDKAAVWDLHRLENRLNAFQGWVLTANGGLFAAPAAILAFSSISSNPAPQSFVILCGIFAPFRLVYTIFLAFRIGDCKAHFLHWFLHHPDVIEQTRSSWNPSTMLALPLTWMAWEFLSLMCSLVSLGVQIFLLDLQSMRSDSSPGSSASIDPTGTPASNSGPQNPRAVPLNMFQLAMFTVAIGWNSIYVVLIHIEIRNAFGKPARDAQPEGTVGAVLGAKVMAGTFNAKVSWMPEAVTFGAEEVAAHEEMRFIRLALNSAPQPYWSYKGKIEEIWPLKWQKEPQTCILQVMCKLERNIFLDEQREYI